MDDAVLDRIRAAEDRGAAAAQALELHSGWYHTLELAPDVVTPGLADLRPLLPKALPASLEGQRCLDVGTFDGLYAFAMEARGATDVVAIDVADPAELDHPPLRREHNLRTVVETGVMPGDGFRTAAAVRRSHARWVACNVYDLAPDRVGGEKDFAVVSTILQHLRNPVGALERVRETLRPGGEVVVVETISEALTRKHKHEPVLEFRAGGGPGNYTWSVPNLEGLRAWCRAALLEEVAEPWTYRLSAGPFVRKGGTLGVLRLRRPL